MDLGDETYNTHADGIPLNNRKPARRHLLYDSNVTSTTETTESHHYAGWDSAPTWLDRLWTAVLCLNTVHTKCMLGIGSHVTVAVERNVCTWYVRGTTLVRTGRWAVYLVWFCSDVLWTAHLIVSAAIAVLRGMASLATSPMSQIITEIAMQLICNRKDSSWSSQV